MIPEATNHMHDLGTGMTRPQVFQCSDGIDRVVKLRNLCAASSLVSDWVGGLLASHLGVLCPAPALLHVGQAAIATMPATQRQDAIEGLAFSNTYIGRASNVLGMDSVIACYNHRELLSRMVTLDSWIHTQDRMHPEFGRNLLIDREDRRPMLLAVDFGMCFAEALIPLLGGPMPVGVSLVMHPDLAPLIDPDEVLYTIALVESTSDAEIVKMVHTTPDEWVTDAAKGKLAAFLIDTRPLVRAAVTGALGLGNG